MITTHQRRRIRQLYASGLSGREVCRVTGHNWRTFKRHTQDMQRGEARSPPPEPVPCDHGRRGRLMRAQVRDGRSGFQAAMVEALVEGLPEEWRRRALALL